MSSAAACLVVAVYVSRARNKILRSSTVHGSDMPCTYYTKYDT